MSPSTTSARPAVPVLTVSSVDPVLRASTCAGLLFDLPGAVVVQHDLEPVDDEGASLLRRTVFDTTGTREQAEVRLEHGCLSCALREDVLPTLLRLAGGRPRRWCSPYQDLGRGRIRARGHFWVPTRPSHACAWDGAGGQLSIGTIGPWPVGRRPGTRLVVTGTRQAHRSRAPEDLRAVFDAVLVDDAEFARGSAWWAGPPTVSTRGSATPRT